MLYFSVVIVTTMRGTVLIYIERGHNTAEDMLTYETYMVSEARQDRLPGLLLSNCTRNASLYSATSAAVIVDHTSHVHIKDQIFIFGIRGVLPLSGVMMLVHPAIASAANMTVYFCSCQWTTNVYLSSLILV